jgi:hypothetical protein
MDLILLQPGHATILAGTRLDHAGQQPDRWQAP